MTTQDYLEQLIQDKSDLVDNLTTKGITGLTGDETFTELVPEVLNIPSGGGSEKVEENDVNFYDYDGTLVKSYTANQFLQLNQMPDNPTHEGLTAQGWNWTLSDAQDFVEENGVLDIGQNYVTSDGKTRVYISLIEGRLDPYLSLQLNGTATIDWGDGSETSSITSGGAKPSIQHIYSNPGDYVISIDTSNTTSALITGTTAGYSYLIWKNTSGTNVNDVYNAMINKVELGSNINLDISAFYNCTKLQEVSVPKNINISARAFYNCYLLKALVIPGNITYLQDLMFNSCQSLKTVCIPKSVVRMGQQCFQNTKCNRIVLPDEINQSGNQTFYNATINEIYMPKSVQITMLDLTLSQCKNIKEFNIPNAIQTINTNTFYNCFTLTNITIPENVTSIKSNAFSGCAGLGKIVFKSTTPPTVESTYSFYNLSRDCKIYVPAGTLETYTTATNYPSSNSYTYIEY